MQDQHDDNQPNEFEHPINALPGSVIALIAVIAIVEITLQLAEMRMIGGADSIGWRITALEEYGFFDGVFEQMRAQGLWPVEHLQRFVTYAFVHRSVMQALLAIVFILAIGKMVGEAYGHITVFAIFFASTIFGALCFAVLVNSSAVLNGAFPAAYGFIGAYSFILWIGLGATDQNQFKAFSLIGVLLGVQLIFGALFGSSPTWIADIGGFAAGFGVAALLLPGNMRRLYNKIRSR